MARGSYTVEIDGVVKKYGDVRALDGISLAVTRHPRCPDGHHDAGNGQVHDDAAIRAMGQLNALPILAVTCRVVQGDRERCIDAGANDNFPKPVTTAN